MADGKKSAPPPPAFTREELLIINNALNEVCNGVALGDDEFQTRIGSPREVALRVLAKVAQAIK